MEGKEKKRLTQRISAFFSGPPVQKPPEVPVVSPTTRPPIPPSPKFLRAQSSIELGRHSLPSSRRESLKSDEVATEPIPPSPLNKQERNKLNVINELIETEKRYVDDLTFTIERYYVPLQNSNIVDTEELKRIFSNIESVRDLNQQLRKEFERYEAGETLESIGDIFLKMVMFFKIYGVYCINRESSNQEYEQLMKDNKAFFQFVHNMREQPESRGLLLSDFLIKPVQRITKYPLLIQEMLKSTDPTDREYGVLSKLLEQLVEINRHVNASAHHRDSLQKVVEIANQLTNAGKFILVTPSRHYRKEGKFKVFINAKKYKEYIFLFSDGILFTEKQSSSSYSFKRFLLLDSFIDPLDCAEECAFELLDENGLSRTLYKIVAPSKEEKITWLAAINEVRRESMKNETRLIGNADRETRRRTWHIDSGTLVEGSSTGVNSHVAAADLKPRYDPPTTSSRKAFFQRRGSVVYKSPPLDRVEPFSDSKSPAVIRLFNTTSKPNINATMPSKSPAKNRRHSLGVSFFRNEAQENDFMNELTAKLKKQGTTDC